MNIESSSLVAPLGPPDGTPGWHRRYQRRQAHARHLLARAVWQAEVIELAHRITQPAECNCGEEWFNPGGPHETWCQGVGS